MAIGSGHPKMQVKHQTIWVRDDEHPHRSRFINTNNFLEDSITSHQLPHEYFPQEPDR